jgi:multiple sugar transport system ATP-binding protein
MNFLTVKVTEKGNDVVLEEGTFDIKPAREHHDYLKKYVGKEVYFGIRPEDLIYAEKGGGENSMPVKITVVEPLGADIHLWVTTNTQPLVARTEPQYAFKVGDTVHFNPRLDHARYFDKETELSILAELDAAADK